MRFKILVSIILSTLVVAGCSVSSIPSTPNISEPIATIGKIANQKEELLVTKLEPGTYNARVEYDANPKFISNWKTDNFEIVINGGYFHEDYSPSGFLVVDGKRIGNRMFDQDKSGMIVVEQGKLDIRDLKSQPIKKDEQFEFALQSYPFLINNGKPAISEDSGKKARRTMVGTDLQGNVYVIISLSDLSLYETMKKIMGLDISFARVINLDGGPSTGIYKNWNNENLWHEGYSSVPSIIRFTMVSKFQAP